MTEERRQIVTVTLNPALDLSTTVPIVEPHRKLRCTLPVSEPGGGGINVARVAARLGADVRAIALLGGATGRQLVALADAHGIEVKPIDTGAETRQSISVREQSTDRQFRFVLPGKAIDRSAMETLTAELELLRRTCLRPVVVISGSLPDGVSPTVMADLVGLLDFAEVVVDTSGPALIEAFRSSALLVKPSIGELEYVVGRSLPTPIDVAKAAQELLVRSAVEAILVSLGSGGALLVGVGDDSIRLRAPTVKVRSTVGAGDSMVGGLAVGLINGQKLVDAAALGVAAGTAAVLTDGSELCGRRDVEKLLPLVDVLPFEHRQGR